MKKHKSVYLTFILICLVLSVLLFPACEANPTETSGTSASSEQPEWPVTVMNAAGEPVVITQKPNAIVATNVWAGEMLLDMVDTSRIKALSAWGDDPVLSATAEKAATVEARVSTQEPEGIIAVQPDLVIIDTFSDPDGSLTKTLKDAGIVILQMASPTDFDQIKEALATLAKAVGEVEKGNELIASVDAILNEVQEKVGDIPENEKMKVMYYEDYYDASGSSEGMLAAYGPGSPFDAIAKAAGTINVCTVENYSAVSKEKVVGEWKPDILIVPSITYGPDFKAIDDKGASIIAAIKEDPIMKTLPAVIHGRVYALTEKYRGSTSHYMAKAVQELAQLAYPDRLS